MAVPAFSPIQAGTILCYGCANQMRPTVQKNNKGTVASLTYYCDKCQYGWTTSTQYVPGQAAKYEPPAVKVGKA